MSAFMAPSLSDPSVACALARLIVRPLVTSLPDVPGFWVLGLILSVIVGSGVLFSCENFRAREEEESFVGNCLAGSPHLLM